MRLKCTCKCGLENYTLEDWLAHWKYGDLIDILDEALTTYSREPGKV